jgi:hypothetical protein
MGYTSSKHEHTLESTITKITNNTDYICIECSPGPFEASDCKEDNTLYLKKSHPNYVELHNKLELNETYIFTYEETESCTGFHPYEITDISSILEYSTCGVVKGFSSVNKENENLIGYYGIVLK